SSLIFLFTPLITTVIYTLSLHDALPISFVVLTAGETLVSPTHLEFSYTQGPVKLKSLCMCTYLLAVSLGNQFTAAVDFFIQNPEDRKSTRLNSSHRTISYAVFCLKKKKK